MLDHTVHALHTIDNFGVYRVYLVGTLRDDESRVGGRGWLAQG